MKRKVVFGIMLKLLLISILTLAFNIQQFKAKAQGEVATMKMLNALTGNNTFMFNATEYPIGSKFTADFNITDITCLCAWQFYISYNTSVVNITDPERDVWIPEENVFKGYTLIPVPPTVEIEPDGTGTLMYGAFMMEAVQRIGVNVTGLGLLSKVNLTIMACPAEDQDQIYSIVDFIKSVPGQVSLDTFVIMQPDLTKKHPVFMESVVVRIIRQEIVIFRDVAILSTTVSRPMVRVGRVLEVSLQIGNLGNDIEIFNVSMQCNDTLIHRWKLALVPFTNTTIDYTLNTTEIGVGTFILRVGAEILDGEVNVDNNVAQATFTVRPARSEPITIYVPDNYTSIAEAVYEADPGDTVYVRAGTYGGSVLVDTPMSLIGENRETTIIDGGGHIRVFTDNSRVSGFTIRNFLGSWTTLPEGGITIKGFNNVIDDNVLCGNWSYSPIPTMSGITLELGDNNTISNNIIASNVYGVYIANSFYNIFRGNIIANNSYRNFAGLGEYGGGLNYFQNIDISNTVNGRPIVYLANKQNLTVNPETYPSEIGWLVLVNSTNMLVDRLNINYSGNFENVLAFNTTNSIIQNSTVSSGWTGINLPGSYNIVIANNTIHDNRDAICAWGSSKWNNFSHNILRNNANGISFVGYGESTGNIIMKNIIFNNTGWGIAFNNRNSFNHIVGNSIASNSIGGLLMRGSSANLVYNNNITDNGIGIWALEDFGSSIFHNNFINNSKQTFIEDSASFWDYGYPSGGNYWSNYTGVDLYSGAYQNETGSDGVGDTPYIIDANNTDTYPLMAPIAVFDVGTWNNVSYNVDVVSNSTVSDFYFDPDEGALLRFNVSSESGTTGFCRVTIPKGLLWVEDGWIIMVGGEPITNYTTISNENYTYLYFTYNHSTKVVQIIGTNVIPEFPSSLILPLFMLATLIAVIIYKRKQSLL